MLRGALLLFTFAACGRIGFEPSADGARGDALARDDGAIAMDLIAHYPMDALAGTSVPANLPAFDGACSACPAVITDGARGSAYRFEGAQWIDLPPSSEAFVGTSAFTITLWVRTVDGQLDRGLVAQPSSSSGTTDSVALVQPAPETVSFETTPNDLLFEFLDGSPVVTVNDGGWHFLAARWDGNVKRMTIDAKVTTSDATTLFDSAEAFIVGADRDGTPRGFLTGDLDDLRFYGRALTDAELLVLGSP